MPGPQTLHRRGPNPWAHRGLRYMATGPRTSAASAQPGPGEADWEARIRELRPHTGADQWLQRQAERLQNRWTSALGPPPVGVLTHPGRSRASSDRATSRSDEEAEAEASGLWTYREVADARRWVQDLDTHPPFGESRFLWYVLGRPVMVPLPTHTWPNRDL